MAGACADPVAVANLLAWKRTDLSSRPRDDYTGDRPWYWVLAEAVTIADGTEATVEAAVGAAERAFARWRDQTLTGIVHPCAN